jgi:DNA invertase Pin-like site-specific DNA recombinase
VPVPFCRRLCPLLAFAKCRLSSKVDRLTRSLGFLSMLLDAGVDVRFADLPRIEGTAGRFMLKQMALVAELEAGFISDRTKAALAAAKRRGKRLGGFRAGARLTAKARQKGADANARAAAARAGPCAGDRRAAGERRCLTAGHRKRAERAGYPDGSRRQVVCGVRP